jgi:hypothetical protein
MPERPLKPSEVMKSLKFVKGEMFSHDGEQLVGCCTLGAVILACDRGYRNYTADECFNRVRAVIQTLPSAKDALTRSGTVGVGLWNDAPERRKRDAVRVLEEAGI